MPERGEPSVEIVNLTGHPVYLEEATGTAAPAGPGATVTISPAPGRTEVSEPVAGRYVRTMLGTFREIHLRRSDHLEGLPPRRVGVVYLVPRLTALAVRGRDDLPFRNEQQRGADQAVSAAASQGRFEPARRRRERLRGLSAQSGEVTGCRVGG